MSQGHRRYSIPRDPPPRGPSRRRGPRPLTVLVALCGLFIVYGTTIPFERVESPVSIAEGWRRALELGMRGSSRTDRAANVLLFLPWGALVAARLGRSGVGALGAVCLAALSGAALSFGVETLQINLRLRVTSLVDLITNTTGATLGGLVGWFAATRAWPALEPRLRRGAAARPVAVLAVAALLGWGLVELAPFVPSLDVGQLKRSVKAARPIPFGPSIGGDRPAFDPERAAVETLTWVLLGGLIALGLRESGRGGGALLVGTIVLAAAARTAIELVELIFPGHTTDASQVVFAALGATVAGAAVASRPRLPARGWIGPALVVWLAATLLDGARPIGAIGPVGELRSRAFFPFYAYFWSPPTSALSTAMEKVASTVPLGALLALRGRGAGPWAAGLVGGALGLGIELIQLFNAERFADFTDVALAAGGAWLGASAVRSWSARRVRANY